MNHVRSVLLFSGEEGQVEANRAAKRAEYRRNAEKYRERRRQYHAKHRESIIARVRAWEAENPARASEIKRRARRKYWHKTRNGMRV